MTEAKKEKQKKKLVELGLMDEKETLIDFLQATHAAKRIPGSWAQGWIYFSDEKIIYPTGALSDNIVIPYSSIQSISKCNQGLFPMGIAITYLDPASGRTEKEKFAMTKRKKWIDFISEKSGVVLS